MNRRRLLSLIVLLLVGASALSPTAAVAAPAESRTAQQSDAKVTYPGVGVTVRRLSGAERTLKGTPRGFKQFIRTRLDEMFEEAGSKPRCATGPTIVIKRYHGGGFASGGEGSYGPCAGGGYSTLYIRSASTWRPILGTQDSRYCQDLAWYAVPAFIGGRTCQTEDHGSARYRLASTPVASPEAVARRVASLVDGFPIVEEGDLLLPAAAEQLSVVATGKAYLDVDECFTAGDAGPVAAQLGDAPYGCAVTVRKSKNRAGSVMLRMNDDFKVTELYPLV